MNTEISEKKQLDRPWLFKPGQSGNPKGKPKGTLSWDTLFTKAVKKIAKQDKLKVKDVEVDMVVTAISKALRGNYVFWKDIMDRNFGSTERRSVIDVDKAIINVQPILGGRSINKCPKCGEEINEQI